MSFRAPKSNYTGDAAQDDLSSEVRRIARTLNGAPFLAGELIRGTASQDGSGTFTDGVACTAGTLVELRHGLGRRALGFLEVTPAHRNTGDPCGLVSEPGDVDLTKAIRFRPVASGTCWVWVF